MKSTYLECLVTVHQTGSINKAALALHTSPPNVSKLLKQFEEELGYDLVIRTPQGVTLTKAGLETLNFARTMLNGLEQLKNKHGSTSLGQSKLKGEIVILCFVGHNLFFLEDFLLDFKNTYPNITLSITVCDKLNALKLISAQPDRYFGIIPFMDGIPLPKEESLKFLPLHNDTFVILSSKQSSLSHYQTISLKKALTEPLVLLPNTNDKHSVILSFLNDYFDISKLSYTIRTPFNFHSAIRNGTGIGIVALDSFLANEQVCKDDFAIIKIRENSTLTSYGIMNPQCLTNPVMAHFHALLSTYYPTQQWS